MKSIKTKLCILAFTAVTLPAGATETADIEQRLSRIRATVMQYGKTLKGHLVQAMQSGGPIEAISVCNVKAPEVAGEIDLPAGWTIGRTSLKLRNPGNTPDDWEARVLDEFEKRKSAGEDPAKLEFHEVAEKDGSPVFRYMKAIPVETPCLACHGTEIEPDVNARLAELYPDDQAQGYVLGEIRGAFTVTQPQ